MTDDKQEFGNRRLEVIASPSVRRLAAERGVDLESLARRLGRSTVAREDVLNQKTNSAPHSDQSPWNIDHGLFGPITRQRLSRPMQVAARRLAAAQSLIPAVTHHDSADISRIEATRARLRKHGRKITALAFHIAVLARCLTEFPRFNASLSPDGKHLILKQYIHIGVAVDAPQGLVVPVIRDAGRLQVSEIGRAIADLAGRARARQIRPAEMGGASMTISSIGGIGGEAFTPIVNPPEVAILGVARTTIRPIWDGQAFQPRPVTPLDLSYDHRVINGADAARFLERYRLLIEDPDQLLVPPPAPATGRHDTNR